MASVWILCTQLCTLTLYTSSSWDHLRQSEFVILLRGALTFGLQRPGIEPLTFRLAEGVASAFLRVTYLCGVTVLDKTNSFDFTQKN